MEIKHVLGFDIGPLSIWLSRKWHWRIKLEQCYIYLGFINFDWAGWYAEVKEKIARSQEKAIPTENLHSK